MQAILAADAAVQAMVLQLASDNLAAPADHAPPHRERLDRARCLIDAVARCGAKRSPESVAALLGTLSRADVQDPAWLYPMEQLVDLVSSPATAPEGAALERVRAALAPLDFWWTRKLVGRINRILWDGRTLRPSGPWSERVLRDIDGDEEPLRSRWRDLMRHLIAAGNPVPSRKWTASLEAHLDAIGRTDVSVRALGWLELAPVPDGSATARMPEHDAIYLKGLIWALASFDDPAVPKPWRTWRFGA